MEIFLAVVSILLIISVFLSLIKVDFWIYKILEYPRLQKLALIIIVTGCWFFFWPIQKLSYQIILGGLFLSIIYLVYKIWPYTILSKKEMRRVKSTEPENELKIFSANVFQDNQEYSTMLQQIKESDPDLIFLLETNASWANAVKELEKDYPYTLLAPFENTYGLLFYSRFKFEYASIRFLVLNALHPLRPLLYFHQDKKLKFGDCILNPRYQAKASIPLQKTKN